MKKKFLVLVVVLILLLSTSTVSICASAEVVELREVIHELAYNYENQSYELQQFVQEHQGSNENLHLLVKLTEPDRDLLRTELSKRSSLFTESGEMKIYNDVAKVEKAYEVFRKINSQFQKHINQSFISEVSKQVEVIYHDKYTPFVELIVPVEDINVILDSSYLDYIIKFKVDSSSQFAPVVIDDQGGGGGTGNTGSSGDISDMFNNQFEAVNLDYPINNLGLTGAGIDVGIIDLSRIDSNLLFLDSESTGDIRGLYSEYYSFHPNQAAAIIAGEDGVAPGSIIHSMGIGLKHWNYDSRQRFMELDIVDFVNDNNISVVNISSASKVDSWSYNEDTLLFDFLTHVYDVTFVVSAGQNCSDESKSIYTLTSVANGYNVITVGGTNEHGTSMWGSSAYLEDPIDGTAKPDIVAPADGFVFDYSEFDSTINAGTSYSAPIVTGVIALMMENDPTLIGDPMGVKSNIIASANDYQLDSTAGTLKSDGYLTRAGAGILDAKKAISGTTNISWSHHHISPGSLSTQVYSINLSWGESLRVSSCLLNKLYSTRDYPNDFTVKLYNPNGVLVKQVSFAGNTTLILEYFVNYPMSQGTYVIKISTSSDSGGEFNHGSTSIATNFS